MTANVFRESAGKIERRRLVKRNGFDVNSAVLDS